MSANFPYVHQVVQINKFPSDTWALSCLYLECLRVYDTTKKILPLESVFIKELKYLFSLTSTC